MMASIPKTVLPPALYKYCPPERTDILEFLQVRFSRPSEFNDAFDSHHLLPRTAEQKVKTSRVMLRTRLGVLCLTERPDNHLMWVNYARNHTGFVIGFDPEDAFFESDGRQLRKVIYQPNPPVFDTADERACFYKAPEWEYEQEWRCARAFQTSESRSVNIDAAVVKEVIFGHHMEASNIAKVMLCVLAHNMSPAFFRSSPQHSEWKLVNKRKEMKLCPHCSGEGFLTSDDAAWTA